MASSAIGPGFLTQTTVFTSKLYASFGFVILMSVVLDVGAQLNVWRIIGVSGKRGQDVANLVLPGLGHFIAFLVVLGGVAFNIGNVAGAGLGLNVLFGLDVVTGAFISAAVAISLFVLKEAGKALDKVSQLAGFLMIFLTLYIAVTSNPPLGEAVVKTFAPDVIDSMSIVTLVGGTVGGYIMFSGAHRLIDAGITGLDALPQISRSSVIGITATGVMRAVLFLATLGVLAAGFTLDPANPPASVFKLAAGEIGYKLFGIVMWIAALTSVIGAAYTSVSFLRSLSSFVDRNNNLVIIAFIIFSTFVFSIVGQPVTVLVVVGTLNGLILPITLGAMLFAAYNKKIVGEYQHPLWMTIFGAVVVALTAYMGAITIMSQLPKIFG
ncbi:MAG TPA: divalent metal cation transporter [Candidatus Avacidaminococcus intestinavium]|uniref:Divalent metal cation transporter n=1 Tax=Candidatus Avacidaminococcus intestinavium TaxID=2840684 RepID=A0A9D1MQE1_9FIRM|nr:divalent metal cation transporter [Candidatus Avacidaminococcus intestinavium]